MEREQMNTKAVDALEPTLIPKIPTVVLQVGRVRQLFNLEHGTPCVKLTTATMDHASKQ
jgi:hypothetical protein